MMEYRGSVPRISRAILKPPKPESKKPITAIASSNGVESLQKFHILLVSANRNANHGWKSPTCHRTNNDALLQHCRIDILRRLAEVHKNKVRTGGNVFHTPG